ncbi:unnamed protein product [Ostreobium quekettii]|uniref:GST N-terminal domain-containing protein n=1 Tax=Ostreobium quekettii TaxID=121088 RepID=A0A8S1JGV3_9CHLO|nr:unnamed protein product [Ostreobium quekettii]
MAAAPGALSGLPAARRIPSSRQAPPCGAMAPSRKNLHGQQSARSARRSGHVVRAAESNSGGGGQSWLQVLCPFLKMFSGGDPAEARPRWLEVTTSGLASITRMPYGTSAGDASRNRASDPAQPLQLYEFEACPFCRRVREAVTDLDLTVDVYPCPKDAIRNRAEVLSRGGKSMFPYLIDPNTGKEMYESAEIVQYLYDTYGAGAQVPEGLVNSTLRTGWMPTLLRIGRGLVRYENAEREAPEKLLELYNYENNQFARLVREALCELELPYRLISAGKGSKNRNKLEEESGKTTVPYLVDPNKGVKMAESDQIVDYLFKNYSRQPVGQSAS